MSDVLAWLMVGVGLSAAFWLALRRLDLPTDRQ